ncbi:MAG: septation protein SpoVG family protein [Candidatus Omnitrophica bacterium]|nr:septation protein SpoVG family protein [Candidatus Omnitrophota bacterium]
MEITEVRVFIKDGPDKKLKAFATVTFDNQFVVRDMKVIEGNNGLFVAMPSRRLKEPCPKCGNRNPVRSKYCSQCGSAIPFKERIEDESARQSDHRDVAHPITLECREFIQKAVLNAYQKELAKGPGTRSYHE